MIGVVATPSELETAREFFELFKTPWEPADPARTYRAILSTAGGTEPFRADAYLVYGSTESFHDAHHRASAQRLDGPVEMSWRGDRIPIYSSLAVFDGSSDGIELAHDGRRVDVREIAGDVVRYRIGYDLFREISHLLTTGQPSRWASIPTLELHIEVLRSLLLDCGIPFVEIPARPSDCDFICCLTHDIDFYGIRRHTFDQTLAGFVARASLGSAIDLVRCRRNLQEIVRNWLALLSLPLVFLKLRRDPWRPFDDYSQVEKGLASTFFLIPFKHQPGVAPDGTTDRRRAVAYRVREIGDDAKIASEQGAEIAVHGIDAWHDAQRGQAELAEVASAVAKRPIGVRMHWLYFSKQSATAIETAGFEYDSTCGYNEAIGFRAGTSQVFRLSGTERLMELPLTIMDTALLFRDRMNLPMDRALDLCRLIVAQVRRFGGTLVINWHDRSLAPERLWGRCYDQLLGELRQSVRAWYATAAEAVEWFRWRRAFRFVVDTAGHVTVEPPAKRQPGPAALVVIRRPGLGSSPRVEERCCDGTTPLTVSL